MENEKWILNIELALSPLERLFPIWQVSNLRMLQSSKEGKRTCTYLLQHLSRSLIDTKMWYR